MSDFGGFGGPPEQDGGFDWMSSLAPILGAAAAFRNPAAGAAIFGIGDYLRRQKMSEIAAQRDQRQQALQQQRDAAVQEHFGGRYPLGTTFQQANDAEAERRRQEIADRAVAKQEASQKAISGAVGLESGMMQGLPSEAAAKLAQITSAVEPASRGAVQPTQQRINAAQEREGRFGAALPFMPPTTGGQTPEQWSAMKAGYSWDPKASMAESLERGGFDPRLAGMEGEKHAAEKTSLQSARSVDELKRVKAELDAAVLAGKIDPQQSMTTFQQIVQGYRGSLKGTPELTDIVAQQIGGGQAGDVIRRPGGAEALLRGESAHKGREERTKYEAVTPAHHARARGDIPIAAARQAAVGAAETDVLSNRKKRLAREELEIPTYEGGRFLLPNMSVAQGNIATPRQRAEGGRPIKMTPKEDAMLQGLTKVHTVVNSLDELSRQLNTATNPMDATKLGTQYGAEANPKLFGMNIPVLPFMAKTTPVTYKTTREGFAGVLSKQLMEEVGVLTQQDVVRVMALVPEFVDTKQTRDLKIGLIRTVIRQSEIAAQRKLSGLPPEDEEVQKGKIRMLIDQSLQEAKVADPLAMPGPGQPAPSGGGWFGGSSAPPPAVGERIQQGAPMTMRRRFNPATGLLEEVR